MQQSAAVGNLNGQPGARVGFGGRIFNLEPHLRQQVAGHFLGETVDQALPAIDALLEGPAAW